MRAAVARIGGLEVTDVLDPSPGPGQVLVRTRACGICGSDLHAAEDLRHFADLTERAGAGQFGLDPEQGVVMGHEFCAEIVDFGPGTERRLPVGTAVCSVPIVLDPAGAGAVGYSNRYPGGLGELMVLQEALLLPVPDGLDPQVAALTEPLAVGEHAVAMAGLTGEEVCLVVGCGPVGLAVIVALRARGQRDVIAADFSPGRRRLAELLGATEVLDPAATSPYGRWTDFGVPVRPGDRAAIEMLGGQPREAVVFEAVGAPGVLQAIIGGAPARARIVVVGVCMREDRIEPFFAVARELQVRFSFGYSAAEFAAVLERLGRRELAVDPLVTDVIGLDDVPAMFQALRTPGARGKVLIRH